MGVGWGGGGVGWRWCMKFFICIFFYIVYYLSMINVECIEINVFN